MEIETILKNLATGGRLESSEAHLLWKNSHLIDLGSHIESLLTIDQRVAAGLCFDLKIPAGIASQVGYLLETYNEIHRSSQNQDYRSWLDSLSVCLPVNLDWRNAIRQCNPSRHSESPPNITCYGVLEIKELAELSKTSLKEILREIRDAGFLEIRASKIGFADSYVTEPECIEKHIWYEMQHTIHEAGLVSSIMIDLSLEWQELIKILELARHIQGETQVLQRCSFYSSKLCLNQMQLEHALKVVAISRCYLSNIPLFELINCPSVLPYLSLFSQIGIERVRKKIDLPVQTLFKHDATDEESRFYRTMWSQILAEVRQSKKTSRIQLRHRFEDTHLSFIDRQQAAPLLLYKADMGDSLTEEESIHLAYTASLYSLGQCAQAIRQQHKKFNLRYYRACKPLTIEPSALLNILDQPTLEGFNLATRVQDVVFDFHILDKNSEKSLATMLEQLAAIKKQHSGFTFAISGLKAFWQKAIQEHLGLKSSVNELVNLGLLLASSSSLETEQDMTHSEILKIHAAFHEAGIPTIAKAEIVVPYAGDEVPLWDRFCQRLNVFKKLQQDSLLKGVGVCLAPGCRLNLSEYLRALAITRIYLKDVNQIMFRPTASEIDQFSSWYELMTSNANLLARYGIDDFGVFDTTESFDYDCLSRQFSMENLQLVQGRLLHP